MPIGSRADCLSASPVSLLPRYPSPPLYVHSFVGPPQTLHRRRQVEADRAKALEKDAADLRKKVEASGERLSRLENVETILFRVHDKVVKDPASVTADNVLKVCASRES